MNCLNEELGKETSSIQRQTFVYAWMLSLSVLWFYQLQRILKLALKRFPFIRDPKTLEYYFALVKFSSTILIDIYQCLHNIDCCQCLCSLFDSILTIYWLIIQTWIHKNRIRLVSALFFFQIYSNYCKTILVERIIWKFPCIEILYCFAKKR